MFFKIYSVSWLIFIYFGLMIGLYKDGELTVNIITSFFVFLILAIMTTLTSDAETIYKKKYKLDEFWNKESK